LEPTAAKTPAARPAPASRARFRFALVAAVVTVVYCTFIGWVQRSAGAASAAFGGFPDEAAHYISGVLMRDYIVGAPFSDPIRYAVEYYAHTPFFAIGVWPPLYYVVEGIWMTVFGSSRESALWLNFISGAALALLVFAIVRHSYGWVASAAAGLMVLAIPVVQWSASLVMVDIACTALALGSLFFLARYFEYRRWTDSLLYGLFAGLAVLTKNSAYYALFVPAAVILLRRDWRVLTLKSFWIAPLTFALLYGPWLLVSRRVLLLGIVGLPDFTPVDVAVAFVVKLWDQTGVLLALALPRIAVSLARPRRTPVAELCLYTVLFTLPFAIFVARVPVQERLLIAAGAAVVIAAVASVHQIMSWSRLPMKLYPGAIALLAVWFVWSNALEFRFPPKNELRVLVTAMTERDGPAPGATLVPSRSEGPWIAEFVQLARDDSRRTLVRPTKFLASESWNATHYKIRHSSVEELRAALTEVPLRYCIIDEKASEYPHDRLLKALLREDAATWRLSLSAGRFTVYENTTWSPQSEERVSAAMRRSALELLR
jgi:hypothetical protein